MNVTVADHLAEVNRLLHDPNNNFWSAADKTANINKAIRRRDLDTGANRTLITLALVVGTDNYSLTTLGNQNVFDVVGIYLINAGYRRLMDNCSFTKLNTDYRISTTMTQEPIAWAKYTPTLIYIGPKPGQAYSTEWDCCQANGTDLATSATDPLPYPFTDPVPYYAAHLCKYNQREFDEADAFKENYWDALRTIEAARAGMLPTGYPIIGR